MNQVLKPRIYIGDIFYNFIEDEINILRVVKCKSTEKFVLKDGNSNLISLNRKELTDNYSRLENNSYFSFAVVKLPNGTKDIIVTIHRKSDIKLGINQVYTVCRQQFNDLFADQIKTNDINNFGVCVSRDTCPENLEFEDYLVCEGIDGKTDIISVYLDDTLDSILKYIDTKKYDDVLKNIYNSVNPYMTTGVCQTLKELLEYQDIMFDFYLGNGITRVPFEVIDNSLNIDQIKYIEHLNKHYLVEPLIVPYNYDMDLNKIERSHIRIIDTNNKIYVVSYLEGGYVNTYFKDKVKDKRDAICMMRYINSKSKHNE